MALPVFLKSPALLRAWLYEKWKNDHGLFYVMLEQGIVSGVNFISNLIILSALGFENYGIYGLIFSLILQLAALQNAIVLSPLTQVMPSLELDEHKNYTRQTLLLGQFFISLLSLLIIYGVFKGYSFFLFQNFNFESLYWVTCFWAITYQVQNFARRYWIIEKRYKLLILMTIVSFVSQLIYLTWMYFFNRENLNLGSILMVFSVTNFMGVLFFALLSDILKKIKVEKQLAIQDRLNSVTSMFFVINLISTVQDFILTTLYAYFLGLRLYGFVNFMWSLFGPLGVVMHAFNNYLTPKVVESFKQTTTQSIKIYLKKRQVLLIGIITLYTLVAFVLILAGFYFDALQLSILDVVSCIVGIYLILIAGIICGAYDQITIASGLNKVIIISSIIYSSVIIPLTFAALILTHYFLLPLMIMAVVLTGLFYFKQNILLKRYIAIKVNLKPTKAKE